MEVVDSLYIFGKHETLRVERFCWEATARSSGTSLFCTGPDVPLMVVSSLFSYVPPMALSLSSYVKAFAYLARELESKDGAACLAASVENFKNTAQSRTDRYISLYNGKDYLYSYMLFLIILETWLPTLLDRG